jgi:hypothetical protein
MISPLEQVSGIYSLVMELKKIDSRLENGQIIFAHRDLNRVIADLDRIAEKMVHPENKIGTGTIKNGDVNVK